MTNSATNGSEPGLLKPTGAMRLSTLAGGYAFVRGITKAGEEQVRHAVNQLDRWYRRPVRLQDLSANLLTEFIKARLTKGLSPRTVRKERGTILTLLRFACASGFDSESPPTVATVRVSHGEHVAWTADELARLLDACKIAKPARQFRAAHWVSLVKVMVDTGLQTGRLLNLQKAAVDLQRGTLFVPSNHLRWPGAKVYTLTADTLEVLSRIAKGSPTGRLFPWPFGKDALRKHFRDLVVSAGLPADRHSLFQRIPRRSQSIKAAAAVADDHAERQPRPAGAEQGTEATPCQ